jgi:hypothetical protein
MNNLAQKYLAYQGDCKNCGDESCEMAYNNNIIPSNSKKVCSNSGFNFGVSSNLVYDPDYMLDETVQSTSPMLSVMDPNRIKNCNQCLSMAGSGPRPSHNGWGDSIAVDNPGLAPAQQLTDIESVLYNLNVKNDRSKKGKVNPVDVFKFETFNSTFCNKDLDPLDTLQTYPKSLYREMSINRFYDLNKNPQENIYYSWTENSQLTAKDNYDNPYPYVQPGDETLPQPVKGRNKQSITQYKDNCSVKVLNRNIISESDSEGEYFTDEESSNDGK